ncbi:MAG: response regulator with CheY-like receiver domain and winged-helix DNA-binding domain [Bacteroidetes bacterium]|jgi:two-component system alkaline phosphatase synthesis response regulator PhoP|nr:response regulator with CheY-like receiver domain and winged-helix DNA-binding domain [Bacteroidota bacterium]
MGKSKILIVEDEQSLANTLALNLRLENYDVLMAYSGNEAERVFNNHASEIGLVLLDVMLPERSGFDLFTEFRTTEPGVPIIFLTAKGQSSDKISGLKLGADDYIVKPFELEELLLRIKNVLKRNASPEPEIFKFGNCSINFETFEIKDVNGTTQTLSRREIGLLKLLTSKENKVISRDEIIDTLWDPDENASSRTIDNYILSFRKHFEENPKEPRHFHSVRGVGYKFTA